jgi:hypothetical protein
VPPDAPSASTEASTGDPSLTSGSLENTHGAGSWERSGDDPSIASDIALPDTQLELTSLADQQLGKVPVEPGVNVPVELRIDFPLPDDGCLDEDTCRKIQKIVQREVEMFHEEKGPGPGNFLYILLERIGIALSEAFGWVKDMFGNILQFWHDDLQDLFKLVVFASGPTFLCLTFRVYFYGPSNTIWMERIARASVKKISQLRSCSIVIGASRLPARLSDRLHALNVHTRQRLEDIEMGPISPSGLNDELP